MPLRETALPRVGLVILTWNCVEAARRCLESVKKLTYPSLDVIVVDNASTDRTEEMVRTAYPGYEFIQTGANLGYTGGNNRGIERALSRGAAYVVVMNPDTVIANPSFVEALAGFMDKHTDVGIAGPRVFLRTVEKVQNTVLFPPGLGRNIVHWFRFRINPDFAHRSGDQVLDAEVLNGVCVMLRATALQQVGLFDESMFMYIEDADLDYRMRRGGWRIVYVPVDSIVHEQKAEGYDLVGNVSFLLHRNSVYYLKKTGRPFQAWGFAALSVVLSLVRGHLRFSRSLFRAYRELLIGHESSLIKGQPWL